MIASWILCNVGNPDRISELAYAVQETGRVATILSLKETYALTEVVDQESRPIIFRGSLNLSCLLKQVRPNWSGSIHSRSDYLCSRYYPAWGGNLVQNEHFFISYGELLRRWDSTFDLLSVDGKLFIRPDSGEKEFNGAVVHRKNKDVFVSDCSFRGVKNQELCVISPPVEIEQEFRLTVANGRVLTGSLYREFGTVMHLPLESYPDSIQRDIVEFAETRLKELTFPKIHCLDIAVVGGKYMVLEVGCFCCCGVYGSDLKKIAQGISEAIES